MHENNVYQNIHQDIIDRCRKGEQKAQFQLYKLYYKAMYNTSYRILNNRMEAEDAMQESFLKAFDKIETYSGKVSFGAWLKRIVINQSLDELKKNKIDDRFIEDEGVKLKETAGEDENDETEKNFNIDDIKEAMNDLPDGYRIVLSLYLLEGYDHDEISQILNISSSTSRSQYTRAKNKLKKQLKEKTKSDEQD
jgi:RNA polymerase sigma-70 factor (ECF subfamily)